MTENFNPIYPNANREPWKKGKLIGPKPPLRPKHVWAIRTKLQLERDTQDLALFNLAIDSKLPSCVAAMSSQYELRTWLRAAAPRCWTAAPQPGPSP